MVLRRGCAIVTLKRPSMGNTCSSKYMSGAEVAFLVFSLKMKMLRETRSVIASIRIVQKAG